MKTKIAIRIFCISLGLLCFSFSLSTAQNTQVIWSTFDMGFAVSSSSSNVSTKSAVGQLFIGVSSIANNRVEAGFLADTLMRGVVLAVKENGEIPATFALHQNYPNPFNPTTHIRFQLPNDAHVTLKVFDVLGREVATLVNEVRVAGTYDQVFSASALASGLYFYRLHAGNFDFVKKMMVLK